MGGLGMIEVLTKDGKRIWLVVKSIIGLNIDSNKVIIDGKMPLILTDESFQSLKEFLTNQFKN